MQRGKDFASTPTDHIPTDPGLSNARSLSVEKAAQPAARPARSSSTGGTPVILAYAATIFFSAFLLFQVQPLISKFILPWFGGSPAVWTAAMLFFQLVLFGGYLYAHLTSTYLSARHQFFLHAALLLIATVVTLVTYISPGESLKPRGDADESPLQLILILLGATVGLPYFVLSSTGPLLQKWFSDAFEGASPYRLFALSNLGSLLALLTYPFFFEVYWDSREQAVWWSYAFAFFAACCAFCAWWTYQARLAQAAQPSKTRTTGMAASDVPPSAWRWAAWIFLPALASMMFLAVTNEVCQNIATVPLLWIIPLSLYLLSFIIAFDHPRWYSRPVYAVAAVVVLLYLANFIDFSYMLEDAIDFALGLEGDDRMSLRHNKIWEFGVYFTGLFLVCMICHCELAGLKPSPKYLTAFFLTMSLGGALGGIFVNLVAPYVFTTFFEFPLGLVAATAIAALLVVAFFRKAGLHEAVGAAVVLAIEGVLLVGYWQIGFDFSQDPSADSLTVHRARNFYGLVSVDHNDRNEPGKSFYTFRSGHIVHGRQWADPSLRHETRIAYWGPGTGCRRAVEYKVDSYDGQRGPETENHCRIGIVGLGIGTIAGMAKEGDYVRMYEINPEVIEIAQGEHFTFLRDCKAKQDIVLGDARLQLERELREGSNQFDVLCLDAFSGDAVPMHLLTTEAFEIYKQHMKPDGIIVANITNTYIDLYPVITRLAQEHGYQHTRIFRPKDPDALIFRTYFTLVTNDEEFLRKNPPEIADLPAEFSKPREVPLWTDRYHSLWHVLQ